MAARVPAAPDRPHPHTGPRPGPHRGRGPGRERQLFLPPRRNSSDGHVQFQTNVFSVALDF